MKPELFGKYLLIDRVSVGGMAEVFKAKQLGLEGFQKIVAIKRLLPHVAADEELSKMFIDEANISATLHHANITQIYDLGRVGEDQYFICMEYVQGRDLRAIFDRLKKIRRGVPLNMAAFVCSKALDGLDYAHNKTTDTGQPLGIVHRDISPPNILISFEGDVKVVDFGIAKAAKNKTQTQGGILKGKFGYMSPEQVRGLPVDRRTDIFAIGIMLYEMITGRRLFTGGSDYEILEKVREADIKPPTTLNPNIPRPLEAAVMRALERDVDKRYATASEFRDDLLRYLYTQQQVYSQRELREFMFELFTKDIEDESRKMSEVENLDAKTFGWKPEMEAGTSLKAPAAAPASSAPSAAEQAARKVVAPPVLTAKLPAFANLPTDPEALAALLKGRSPSVGTSSAGSGTTAPPNTDKPQFKEVGDWDDKNRSRRPTQASGMASMAGFTVTPGGNVGGGGLPSSPPTTGSIGPSVPGSVPTVASLVGVGTPGVGGSADVPTLGAGAGISARTPAARPPPARNPATTSGIGMSMPGGASLGIGGTGSLVGGPSLAGRATIAPTTNSLVGGAGNVASAMPSLDRTDPARSGLESDARRAAKALLGGTGPRTEIRRVMPKLWITLPAIVVITVAAVAAISASSPYPQFLLHPRDKSALARVTFLSNEPGTQVSYDDAKLCQTPCVVPDFPAGKYRFSFVKSGFLPTETLQEIRANEDRVIAGGMYLEGTVPGALLIDSDPRGADIFINGERVEGTTPTLVKKLPSGKRLMAGQRVTVKLTMPNYGDELKGVDILPDQVTAFSGKLNPSGPVLVISSDPPGATIRMDGGLTPHTTPYIWVGLGRGTTHTVRLEREGFKPFEETVRLPENGEIVLRATLDPDTKPTPPRRGGGSPTPSGDAKGADKAAEEGNGWLEISTIPATEIYVDGKSIGKRTPSLIQLPAGVRRIRLLNREENVFHEEAVQIKRGETTRMQRDLRTSDEE